MTSAQQLDLSAAKGRWLSLADLKYMDEGDARQVFLGLRWKDGVVCPHCGWDKVYEYTSRQIYRCGKCEKQFSETTHTFFRSRKLPFKTILLALATLKTGTNPWRLSQAIDVNYRTAIAIAQKVNSVMSLPPPEPLRYHNVSDTHYPYVIGRKLEGTELVLAVNNVVPRSLPEQIRSEVCQDLLVAILSGELDAADLGKKASVYLKKAFRMFPTRYGAISLNEPAPWLGGTDKNRDMPLIEMLDSEVAHW